MKPSVLQKFFSPNIGPAGRVARGMVSLGMFVAAWVWREDWRWAAFFAGGGIFTLFEALRGWCIARACGLKTPM